MKLVLKVKVTGVDGPKATHDGREYYTFELTPVSQERLPVVYMAVSSMPAAKWKVREVALATMAEEAETVEDLARLNPRPSLLGSCCYGQAFQRWTRTAICARVLAVREA